MKVSIRTVNRVWGHWMKNMEPLAPKNHGRPTKSLGESDIHLILEIRKEQNSGAWKRSGSTYPSQRTPTLYPMANPSAFLPLPTAAPKI
jgi:hypothetical protein